MSAIEISQKDTPTKSLDFRTTLEEAWASVGTSKAIKARTEVLVARDFRFSFIGGFFVGVVLLTEWLVRIG
jgi:hypothetical protein